MQRYIFLRVVQALITIVGISMVVFMLIHLSGDPLSLFMPLEATKEDYENMRVYLGWLPTSGMGGFKKLIMPSFTLGASAAAAITRMTRSTMLDVLDTEYIRMARVKGVSELFVITKHAFKNAMIPVVTVVALNLIFLINGTVITETIFNWPGVSRLVVDSILARDYPVVQTCLLMASFMYVFANLFVDILYAYLDPRIRYQ